MLCLGLGALPFSSRRLLTPYRRKQRSSPERDTFGFKNSRTTARRSSRGSSSVWRRELPRPLAQVSGLSEGDVACGFCPPRCHGDATYTPSAPKSRVGQPEPMQPHCWPGSRRGFSGWSSPRNAVEHSICAFVSDLPQQRACHKKRLSARFNVINRDGILRYKYSL